MSELAYKWLPVIDTDACGGCGECQRACPPRCIDLVWDFATLTRPEDCTSCNLCMEACAHDVIRMNWVATPGSQGVGSWRDALPAPAPAPQTHWFRGLVVKLDHALGLTPDEDVGCGVVDPGAEHAVPD